MDLFCLLVNRCAQGPPSYQDFRYPTSNDVAEVVVTASSRSEARYELFRRPLRLQGLQIQHRRSFIIYTWAADEVPNFYVLTPGELP